jgi:hypothetical protein
MSQTATVMAKFCSAPVPQMAADAAPGWKSRTGLTAPYDVTADQEAVQDPGASVSLGSKPHRRCRGPFPLYASDDLRYLG